MKILVFGVTGFIGSRAAARLVGEGHEVYGFLRGKSEGRPEGLAGVVYGDLLEAQSVEEALGTLKPDGVLFAAGERYPNGRVGGSYLELMQRSRVEGTRNVLEAIVRLGLDSCFVSVSGALAYKRSESYKGEIRQSLSREMDEVDGSTWFGDTLLKWEGVIQSYVNKGVNATILRLGAVYGWGGVWKERFFEPMHHHSRVYVPGNGRISVSFVHVEDVASAISYIYKRCSPGEVYNVVDDEPILLRVFLDEASKIFGAPPPLYVPLFLARLSFGAAYRLIAPSFTISQAVSNEKIKKLGFEFRYPTYREGLQQVKREAEKQLQGKPLIQTEEAK
ncbi:MAG: NAD(P)-dependent oxidoreductase [Thermoprotei archaeon]